MQRASRAIVASWRKRLRRDASSFLSSSGEQGKSAYPLAQRQFDLRLLTQRGGEADLSC